MTHLLASYESKDALVRAYRMLRSETGTGTRAAAIDDAVSVYTSYPLEEFSDISQLDRVPFSRWGLIGAILGGSSGYFMQYDLSAVAFPLDIGGKPLHSAVAFIPVTFECTILGAALFLLAGFMISLRLPQPYHPLFDSAHFNLAASSPYFIVIDARLASEVESAREKLRATAPIGIDQVEGDLP